jgi:hypothetical protein
MTVFMVSLVTLAIAGAVLAWNGACGIGRGGPTLGRILSLVFGAGVFLLSGGCFAFVSLIQVAAQYTEIEPFDPTAWAGEVGTVTIPAGQGMTLVTRHAEAGRRRYTSGATGALLMPAGEHLLQQVTANQSDGSGGTWSLHAALGRRARTLTVSADGQKSLEPLPSLVAWVRNRGTGADGRRRLSFELSPKGGDGEPVRDSGSRFMLLGQGRRGIPFSVRERGGAVVHRGRFEYG